jgi:hypothetical protein
MNSFLWRRGGGLRKAPTAESKPEGLEAARFQGGWAWVQLQRRVQEAALD